MAQIGTTDANGRLEVDLPVGHYTFSESNPLFKQAAPVVVDLTEQGATVQFTLDPKSGHVLVVVLDRVGAPVAGTAIDAVLG